MGTQLISEIYEWLKNRFIPNKHTMFPKIGDTGEVKLDDWILYGNSELLSKIEQLPIIDNVVYFWDQYVHKRHHTSCTKFAYCNQWFTIFNDEGSREKIDAVESKSLELGRQGPGYGRSSSMGAEAVRKTFGKISKRQVTLFSTEWYALMEKQRPVGISIFVDSNYWRDVKDGVLNTIGFAKSYGHATTIQKKGDGYEMLDSVHKYRYAITEEQLHELVLSGNVRSYGYVLLPLDKFDLPNYVNLVYCEKELENHLQKHPKHTLLRNIMNRNRLEPRREKIMFFLSTYGK